MEFVDPDDEPGRVRYPPPPDDRLWRHPSEIGTTVVPEPARPSMWVVAAVSAVSAGLLATGLVVVAIGMLEPDPAFRPVERHMVPRTGAIVETGGVVDVVAGALPAVVRVQLDSAAGSTAGSGAGDTGGTGVIFRSDGHVVTNAHVVGGASAVRVILDGGKEVRARVLGTDPDTDTSVLKIDADGPLPTVTLGSASDLRVGQRAIAIGYSHGAGEPSATVGIVSGLHRSVKTKAGGVLIDMVQTDRPVAASSSGGALLDADGSVVGITNSHPSAGDGGFGFATPIDAVMSVADELIDNGRVVGVWLGIEGTDADSVALSQADVSGGAMVGQVTTGSPAERAGIHSHDVIVELDGVPIGSMDELVVAVRHRQPGEDVVVDVMRGDERRSIQVTLGERPPTTS